jgi:hypothetical protein
VTAGILDEPVNGILLSSGFEVAFVSGPVIETTGIEAATALACACAIRSAVFASVFFPYCDPCVLLFDLPDKVVNVSWPETLYHTIELSQGQTYGKGICRSCKSWYSISQISVRGSNPKDHGHSSGGSVIFLRVSAVASNKPTLRSCRSIDKGFLSKGAHNSFFHFTQFFSSLLVLLPPPSYFGTNQKPPHQC